MTRKYDGIQDKDIPETDCYRDKLGVKRVRYLLRTVVVYIHAGLLDAYLYAWMCTRTHVHMVPYGRRMDRGLKYFFVEDTGSGSFPLS